MQLTSKEAIPDILKTMTIEEKVTLLTGASMFKGAALQKYGIPAVYYLDGGTGANYIQILQELYETLPMKEKAEPVFDDFYSKIPAIMEYTRNPESEELKQNPEMIALLERIKKLVGEYVPEGELPGCFPPGIVLASSWDANSIYESGRALAKEAHYYKINVLLGTPNVNVHRNPLGGRLFEGYSEDPCLIERLAPAFVKGIQEEGIVANVKHFAANNQETDRMSVNEHIPMRALQEIYFPGFKACIEAGCKTVMSAYNGINGDYCAQSHWLLTDILKKDWGFDGYVVSDWGAAYDQVKSLQAGNDVAMPGPRSIAPVLEAVEKGELAEKTIDESASRYLTTLLDMPAIQGRRYDTLDRQASHKSAYNSCKESIILLKNEKATLPLSKQAGVCFFGEKSKHFIESGGGSANVVTRESTSLYGTMKEKLGDELITYEEIHDTTETVVITVGIIGREGADRPNLLLPPAERDLLARGIALAKKAGKKVVVILNVCGPVDLNEYIEDIDALLCIFIPGMEGGHAVADVLLGEINPSGKLPITFPKRYEDVPSSDTFPGRNGEVWYGEGIFVGYRYYDYRQIEPMYPFGYGLSYTTFSIENAHLSKEILQKDEEDTIDLTLRVRNTGKVAGKEVVQLYIGEKNSVLVRPPKELKNFAKVEVLPGQTKEITFTITARELASFDETTGEFQVQPDTYVAYVGTSSRNIRATLTFTVIGYNPYGINEDTKLVTVAATEGAVDTLASFCPKGLVKKEGVELQSLGDNITTLKMYWENNIKPKLPMEEKEKELQYANMLKAMNEFVI